MNFAILSFIIGFILQFEALFLLLPWIVGMIYREYHVALIYLATAVVCFILGKLLSFRHTGRFKELYVREGFTAVALGWFVMSVFGAIPFVLTGEIPFYIDGAGRFRTISTLSSRRSPALLPQVPVSCPTWKHSAMPACSGAASLTGSAVWAYSYSLWRSCR